MIHIENPLDLVAVNKIRLTSMVSEHWYVSANVLNVNIIEVISLKVFIFILVCPFVAFSSLFFIVLCILHGYKSGTFCFFSLW